MTDDEKELGLIKRECASMIGTLKKLHEEETALNDEVRQLAWMAVAMGCKGSLDASANKRGTHKGNPNKKMGGRKPTPKSTPRASPVTAPSQGKAQTGSSAAAVKVLSKGVKKVSKPSKRPRDEEGRVAESKSKDDGGPPVVHPPAKKARTLGDMPSDILSSAVGLASAMAQQIASAYRPVAPDAAVPKGAQSTDEENKTDDGESNTRFQI